MGHCTPHKLVVLAEAVCQASNGGDKDFSRIVCLAGVEEVDACVRAYGPVGMLAITVDTRKGLLVGEDLQAQLGGLIVADLHEEDIAVSGAAGRAEDGRHLVLPRRNLVVLHSHGTAHPEHLSLNLVEQLLDPEWHGRKVVQLGLLVAWGQSPHERAPTVDQVRSLLVHLCGHDEELLLPAEVGVHDLGVRADLHRLEQADALLGQGVNRT
mmetsp:Transcript_149837/g.363965  ORF Transcript_149837/g.363965 Transcript_149837/m.363965 type:complete len:211 (+) Transcript_149837:271-903(+)